MVAYSGSVSPRDMKGAAPDTRDCLYVMSGVYVGYGYLPVAEDLGEMCQNRFQWKVPETLNPGVLIR